MVTKPKDMNSQTLIAPEMTIEEFLNHNTFSDVYSEMWKWKFKIEEAGGLKVSVNQAWMQEERTREKAQKDIDLFVEGLTKFEERGQRGPQVGEFIRGYDGKTTRFTTRWTDSIQAGGGQGGFHLFLGGSLSYSGGLNDPMPYDLIELTEERQKGEVWIFHLGWTGGHRSVYYSHSFRVWKVKTIDSFENFKRLPYQYKQVAEVTERLYSLAKEAAPRLGNDEGFIMAPIQTGESDVVYSFAKINGKYYMTTGNPEEAKRKFAEFIIALTNRN